MRYVRILSAVTGTPWAIHPEKGRAIMGFLAFAAAGGKRTPAEVEAIIGRPPGGRHAYDDDETADERRERRARVAAAEESRAIADRGGIAVLSLKGVISPRMSDEMDASGPGGTSAEGFTQRLREALADSRVAGIIIDGDSPGGNVYGVPEAFAALMAARGDKPIVAIANPMIASAAYWITCAADEIVVSPSGEIGSVGVYSYHEDLSQLLADAGVVPSLIKASISPQKAETHPAFPLTDEARAAMQESVDRYGRAFVSDIAKGRGLKAGDVIERFGGGRMLGAKDAVAAGMADRIGTLDDELARMAKRIAKAPAKTKSAMTAADLRRRVAVW